MTTENDPDLFEDAATTIPDTPASGVPGEDLFPLGDEDQERKIVAWCEKAFEQAKTAKQRHQDKWDKYYKMYRSYVRKRGKADWRAKNWMPIAFFVIETITPKLVAQLPKFTVSPVGPDDEPGAELMEDLLEWAADQSDLYLELVKAIKSSLIYGTGILKTSLLERTRFQIKQEQEMQQTMTQIPSGQLDINGNPQMTQVPGQPMPTGQMVTTRTPYVAYTGPAAEAVDIENFFVDPLAESVESARYVIHRVYRDKSYIEDQFRKGNYKKPPDEIWTRFLTEHSSLRREALVELGPGGMPSFDKGVIAIMEFWTDNVIVTVAGSESGGFVLLRAEKNPYAHGEKPFVRIVDHLIPHEFWGIGEMEPLEGLQDTFNALWNSRIDNVSLVLQTMFTAVMDYVIDPSELVMRPGGVIRLREGIPPNQAIQPLELGEVTESSYKEAAEIERMTEKTTGVSPYQTGEDSPAYNRTATGIALISEQGNSRLAHKVTIAELTGFKRLARQFGSIIQQFVPPEMVIRLKGGADPMNPMGSETQFTWARITPDAIGGRYDYDIEAQSSTQTESVRREQALSLFQMLGNDPLMNPLKLRENVLKVFGIKDPQDYMVTPQQLQMMQQQQMAADQAAQAPAPEQGGGPPGAA